MGLKYSVEFTETADIDLKKWKKSGNKIIQNKITTLLNDISEHPDFGLGKPEQLVENLSGYWSRRIDSQHRIVYRILAEEKKVIIHSLYGHY